MNQYDVIIVGAGPAGMSAAVYAARAELNTLMVDFGEPGGQINGTNVVQNYIGVGSISGSALGYRMFQHTRQLKVPFQKKKVVKIEAGEPLHRVYMEGEEEPYLTRSIILAIGTTPKSLHVENEEKFSRKGISWCAICDGAQYAGKDVVVIGGGNSGVKESLFLSNIVTSLTMLTNYDLTADEVTIRQLKSKTNVQILTYQNILGFVGEEKLEGVRTLDTKSGQEQVIPCAGVFEYIGLDPHTNFLHGLHIMNHQGYIVVNPSMETSIPGIYGAGDCTVKDLRQVVTACSDGAIAAQNASHYLRKHGL